MCVRRQGRGRSRALTRKTGGWFLSWCYHCWCDTALVTHPPWASVSLLAGELKLRPFLPAASALHARSRRALQNLNLHSWAQQHLESTEAHTLMILDQSPELMQFSKTEATQSPDGPIYHGRGSMGEEIKKGSPFGNIPQPKSYCIDRCWDEVHVLWVCFL